MRREYKIRIRKMKKTDIPVIGRIVSRVLSCSDAKKAREDMTEQSKELYPDEGSFVAEINGQVIGLIGYWRLSHFPKNVAWLDWFAVDKEYENHGIGSELLNHMLHILSKKNFKILCCERSSKDKCSEKFYKDHKFIECGRIKKYWEDGGDLVLLFRNIR
jgi:ribosomal protein S18 acetylase RimI-like enzyme